MQYMIHLLRSRDHGCSGSAQCSGTNVCNTNIFDMVIVIVLAIEITLSPTEASHPCITKWKRSSMSSHWRSMLAIGQTASEDTVNLSSQT